MRKKVIIGVWLVGLTAIVWACSGRHDAVSRTGLQLCAPTLWGAA
jgi:hypothetical protein